MSYDRSRSPSLPSVASYLPPVAEDRSFVMSPDPSSRSPVYRGVAPSPPAAAGSFLHRLVSDSSRASTASNPGTPRGESPVGEMTRAFGHQHIDAVGPSPAKGEVEPTCLFGGGEAAAGENSENRGGQQPARSRPEGERATPSRRAFASVPLSFASPPPGTLRSPPRARRAALRVDTTPVEDPRVQRVVAAAAAPAPAVEPSPPVASFRSLYGMRVPVLAPPLPEPSASPQLRGARHRSNSIASLPGQRAHGRGGRMARSMGELASRPSASSSSSSSSSSIVAAAAAAAAANSDDDTEEEGDEEDDLGSVDVCMSQPLPGPVPMPASQEDAAAAALANGRSVSFTAASAAAAAAAGAAAPSASSSASTTPTVAEPRTVLPCFRGTSPGPKRVTCETLQEALAGRYAAELDGVLVFDLRYTYEYEGGHIPGAINITSPLEQVTALFEENKTAPRRVAIVFHCEFSAQRGPRAAQLFRKLDREYNHGLGVTFADVYVLDGGYKKWHATFPAECRPAGQYVSMWDAKFTFECKRQKAQRREAWGDNLSSRASSRCGRSRASSRFPQQHRRSQSAMSGSLALQPSPSYARRGAKKFDFNLK